MSSSSRLIAQKPERFLCPLCRTDVGREYDLRRHQQECHTTPKECPERGCKYTTRREARLLEHMRVKKHGLYSPQYRLLLDRDEQDEVDAISQTTSGSNSNQTVSEQYRPSAGNPSSQTLADEPPLGNNWLNPEQDLSGGGGGQLTTPSVAPPRRIHETHQQPHLVDGGGRAYAAPSRAQYAATYSHDRQYANSHGNSQSATSSNFMYESVGHDGYRGQGQSSGYSETQQQERQGILPSASHDQRPYQPDSIISRLPYSGITLTDSNSPAANHDLRRPARNNALDQAAWTAIAQPQSSQPTYAATTNRYPSDNFASAKPEAQYSISEQPAGGRGDTTLSTSEHVAGNMNRDTSPYQARLYNISNSMQPRYTPVYQYQCSGDGNNLGLPSSSMLESPASYGNHERRPSDTAASHGASYTNMPTSYGQQSYANTASPSTGEVQDTQHTHTRRGRDHTSSATWGNQDDEMI